MSKCWSCPIDRQSQTGPPPINNTCLDHGSLPYSPHQKGTRGEKSLSNKIITSAQDTRVLAKMTATRKGSSILMAYRVNTFDALFSSAPMLIRDRQTRMARSSSGVSELIENACKMQPCPPGLQHIIPITWRASNVLRGISLSRLERDCSSSPRRVWPVQSLAGPDYRHCLHPISVSGDRKKRQAGDWLDTRPGL